MDSSRLAQEVAAAIASYVDTVVLCPGSRNSPLSLALLARPDIRTYTRIDERSAAFLALGMARATGHHVGVVTTSGTAVANCLPAMIEAAHSHVPLVVISADRPQRLIGTGANQTIQQDGLFHTVTPTVQVTSSADIPAAFQRQQVHLNVALDVPLVDGLPELPRTEKIEGAKRISYLLDHGEIKVDLSRDTLVIAGDEAWEVEQLLDLPTIAEPSAPAPYRPVHPLAKVRPEQVIVVGHPTLHRQVLALLDDPAIEVFGLSRTAFTRLGAVSAEGSRIVTTGQPRPGWLEDCERASQAAATTVRQALEQPFGFTGLHVMAAVGDTLATGDTLFLGSSNPVRDASLVGLPFPAVDTYTPRGTAGIDGCVSQAIGVAYAVQSAHPDLIRAPRTVAVLGDVTMLYDVGGLFIPNTDPLPENLTIVVSNDQGCGIFSTLEIGAPEYAPRFEQAFGAGHEVCVADLASAYGVEYHQATSTQELIEALIDTTDVPGFRIIEATTTRETRRALHDWLGSHR